MYNCAGCDLNEECSGGDISNEICSVGNVLQCQCEYSQIAGDDNTCFDGGWLYIGLQCVQECCYIICIGVRPVPGNIVLCSLPTV